ncbi:hypothetical protein ROZALSC1DRAFT_27547 [Rozella allomycis CSF55]|uniref:Chitin-binding type-4 domain-containing protein n=1 Tax=Rozella allomycis (strain CSF55) TaxID=988480 RepID=A0A075AXA7_ROZAC|nr:hypothetical protein O9G_001685 [Rozella allomycis CSF55]RKP21017.1 hypothetical protein ROZALSC1DRAFT_27547 [Rozella allomycis CSF55]|eukprot:EPZ34955.1 hypothetical protein O9G_001685 [Rozella allomycis CSF55]
MIVPSILIVLLARFASCHSSMLFPPSRCHPMNPNSNCKDSRCITTPLNGGPGCSPKPFPCGYSQRHTPTTVNAGEVINVKFWNSEFPNGAFSGGESKDQARHNGGLCEFSLSYDEKTFNVIATYERSCPDIFFDWPVRIPDNAPACENCLFAWSWINALGNREFYMNCADVKIVNPKVPSGSPFSTKPITTANLAAAGFTNTLTPDGDVPNNGNGKGSGPRSSDVSKNTASSAPVAAISSPNPTSTVPPTAPSVPVVNTTPGTQPTTPVTSQANSLSSLPANNLPSSSTLQNANSLTTPTAFPKPKWKRYRRHRP